MKVLGLKSTIHVDIGGMHCLAIHYGNTCAQHDKSTIDGHEDGPRNLQNELKASGYGHTKRYEKISFWSFWALLVFMVFLSLSL